MQPGVYGSYNRVSNVLPVAGWLVDECSSACNPLISVINHEFGHTIGWDDFDSGCETSIMSHARDRNTVTGPSDEDMCWMYERQDYCEQGDDPKACRPYLHLQSSLSRSTQSGSASKMVVAVTGAAQSVLVDGHSSLAVPSTCRFRSPAPKR
jgi:hypothetical protein